VPQRQSVWLLMFKQVSKQVSKQMHNAKTMWQQLVSRLAPAQPPAHTLLLSNSVAGAVSPAAFEAWCAAHPGSRCRLWVGADLAVSMLAPAGAGLADEAGLAAYAQRVLAHSGFEPPAAVAAWRSGSSNGLRAWFGRIKPSTRLTGKRYGVSLLQNLDLAGLRSVAQRHQVQLVGLWPYWVVALAQACRDRAVCNGTTQVLVVEGRLVTVLGLQQGQLTSLAVRWLPVADAAQLQACLGPQELVAGDDAIAPVRAMPADATSWAIGHSLPGTAPKQLRLLGSLGTTPAQLSAAADRPLDSAFDSSLAASFLPQATVKKPLHAAFAVTAAVVLALAAFESQQAWQAVATAAAPGPETAALNRPMPPTQSSTTPNVPQPSGAQSQALQQLAYPWQRVFAATETRLPAGTTWRALEHRAGAPELRLVGTARSLPQVLQLAQDLGSNADWHSAWLARTEPVLDAAGTSTGAVEFELLLRPAAVPTP
jgi:hypothetical protein